MISSAVMTRLEDLQPDIAAQLYNITSLAPASTDASLLKLCASYIDAALRLQNWTPPKRDLSEKEQAFIAFTEQFLSSVGTMTNEQVACLQQFASADEVYNFVNAIYVIDMSKRLELVAGRVLL